MMEMVSKGWSRGLRIEDLGKEARVPGPVEPPQAPADSPGWLPALISTYPHNATVLY